jgi:hypothetical protein
MNDDELHRRFEALPAPPLPPRLAAAVLGRARAEFEGRGASRFVAAAAAVGAVAAICVYLTWAVAFLGALAPAG